MSTDVFAKFSDKEVGTIWRGEIISNVDRQVFRGESEMFFYQLNILFFQIEYSVVGLVLPRGEEQISVPIAV